MCALTSSWVGREFTAAHKNVNAQLAPYAPLVCEQMRVSGRLKKLRTQRADELHVREAPDIRAEQAHAVEVHPPVAAAHAHAALYVLAIVLRLVADAVDGPEVHGLERGGRELLPVRVEERYRLGLGGQLPARAPGEGRGGGGARALVVVLYKGAAHCLFLQPRAHVHLLTEAGGGRVWVAEVVVLLRLRLLLHGGLVRQEQHGLRGGKRPNIRHHHRVVQKPAERDTQLYIRVQICMNYVLNHE